MKKSQIISYAKKGLLTTLGILLALYFFVILLTHSSNDPGWSYISSDMTSINNMGGWFGALLSDFLYIFLGFSAWWFLFFLLYESACLWFFKKTTYWVIRQISYLFLILASSAILAQSAQWIFGKFALDSGGIVGVYLSGYIVDVFGEVWSIAFLSVFILLTMTVAFNIYWHKLFYSIISMFQGFQGDILKGDMLNKALNKELDKDHRVKSNHQTNKNDNTKTKEDHIQKNNQSTQSTQEKHEDKYKWEGMNLLESFLQDSGLSESLKKQLQEEQEREQIEREIKQKQQEYRAQKQAQQEAEEKAKKEAQQKYDTIEEYPDKKLIDNLEKIALNLFSTHDNTEKKQQKYKPLNQTEDKNVTEIMEIKKEVESDKDQKIENNNINDNIDNITEKKIKVDQIIETEADKADTNITEINQVEVEEVESMDQASVWRDFADFANQVSSEETTNANLGAFSEGRLEKSSDFGQNLGKFKSRSMQTAAYRASLSPIPPLSLLDSSDPTAHPQYSEADLQRLSELLEIKLQEFNIKAEVENVIVGPVVTRFEVQLAPGVKASKVTNIARDLARSMSMASLRVLEVIAGKTYIGIEVPSPKRQIVRLIDLLDTPAYHDKVDGLYMAMGKDIGGTPVFLDLVEAPHMLVAGTTGSGKSVLVNAILLSMLLKYTPEELRLILIDPKQLELANYNDIPHLLTPVVTDMTEATGALSWCVAEMERRYTLMSLLKVRKVSEFNKRVLDAERDGTPIIDPLWRPTDSVSMDHAPKLKPLPLIVIVADEFADMIMQVGKQAEELITRLAQKSRAAGIHLMLATQRPSVDVITGLIKANVPVRVGLRVSSKVDSRTILDSVGAEDMLGHGDMLILTPKTIEPERVHGAFVSDEEVNRVCDAWRERGTAEYISMVENFTLIANQDSSSSNTISEDELYDKAVAYVIESRRPTASGLQRQFSIGYNKAARIIDRMEKEGLVSAQDKRGMRTLLVGN